MKINSRHLYFKLYIYIYFFKLLYLYIFDSSKRELVIDILYSNKIN